MDVLEVGDHDAQSRRRAPSHAWLIVIIAALVVLAVAMAIGVTQWWSQQASRPEGLEITGLEAIGPFAISGVDLPEDWPRDLVVGALRLRVAVAGDPQRTTRVDAAGDTGAYVVGDAQANGAQTNDAQGVDAQGVDVPAGERSEIDVVVTPADCGAIDFPASPLVVGDGAEVPMSPEAARTLAELLVSLCDPGESAPVISADSVRVDVFFRDRTLVMRARVSTTADRVVLQPRDSIGFTGRGEQEATMEDGVATARLRWLISPAEAIGLEAPTVRVRAFAVTGGRGYPWVLDLRVPAGLSMSTPGGQRNDGVDLAEVAPRP